MSCLGSIVLAVALALPMYATPSYAPVGPQTNIDISTVLNGGWTECYHSTMSTVVIAATILGACQGGYIMMAGRATGSNTLIVLAQALMADATFNTGATSATTTHNANGSEWYFADTWSWGFAPSGGTITHFTCDTTAGADRMCIDLTGSAGGYRIGSNLKLQNSAAFEKVFFVAAGVPEPGTVALTALGLALAALRRYRAPKRSVTPATAVKG